MNVAVQIQRDPFTRSTLMRVRIDHPLRCSWCNNMARFRYYHEPDDRAVTPPTVGPAFCSVGCWRSYQ